MSLLPPEALSFYLSLGHVRSYQSVADHFGVTKRAVTKRAARDGWQDRVSEVEHQAQERATQKAIETLDQMNDRHLKALRVIQGKAIQTLKEMPLGTAMEAVRSLDLAIKHERTIRGEPSERTAVCVEDQIRGEYARWLAPEDPSCDDAQ